MTNLPSRPKGPQPVIDALVPSTNGHTPEPDVQPSASYSRSGLQEPTPRLIRSSTQFVNTENGVSERESSASPAPDTRPKLLRAKSDFGPRRESNPGNDDTDSKTSGETEWGIRHGFDTQLASEEWNNMLNSVCAFETF
jgi:regulatory associated protein of mTOR